MRIDSAAEARMRGLSVVRGRAGITTESTGTVVLEECDVRDAERAGISCGTGTTPVLRDCRISGTGTAGLVIGERATPSVEGCTVRDAAGSGLVVGPGKGATTKNTGSQSTADALWADGSVDTDSNDYWDQSTVTVKSTKPLGSLKVVVRVMQTGGVSSTGVWTSLGDDSTVGENSTSEQLGYVITLKPGVTLAPGTYVFKVQYNHAQGRRDAGRDLYSVTAETTDADDEYLSGRF